MSFALQHSDLLRSRATASQFDPHLHSTFSITALRSGAAKIRSDRWSGVVGAGDVFFFNPYEVHSARCSEEHAEYVTLYASNRFLSECLKFECHEANLNIQTAILHESTAAKDLIDALFAPAVDENLVRLSLRRVLAACAFSTDASLQTHRALAINACLLIRKNCTRAIRTDELAREMGVHRSHLVRAFSNTVGMAPQTYIRQVRVAKARDLICEGSDLSEVALMLDFSDQAHLTREFKKVFGVPPGVLSRDLYGRAKREAKSGLRASCR